MSGNDSTDDQSEDGELQSPVENKEESEGMEHQNNEDDDDPENVDALDIKPPQAKVSNRKTKRREHEKTRHKRSDRSERHREERHSHREKHHRDKSSRSLKEREHYQKERDRYYREQMGYTDAQYLTERAFRERKAEEARNRHIESRKQEKIVKDVRGHGKDQEKHKREKHDEENRDRASKALADLRERLIEKRTKGDDSAHKHGKRSRKDRKYRLHHENHEDPLEGEAGSYVKEIINITTEERKNRKDKEGEKQLTEEEKQEQEQRREKLLEAEREMARLKERSRVERERRHLEKVSKRKNEEEDSPSKRVRSDDVQIVMVSDASDEAPSDINDVSEKSLSEGEDVISDRSRSRSVSDRSKSRSRSRSKSRSRSYSGDESVDSERNSRSKTKSRSRSLSKSRSRSRSRSHSSDRSRSESVRSKEEDDEMLKDKDKDEKEEKNGEEKKPIIDDDLPPYYPAVQGCRSVEEFQCLNRIEEGTYGVVYRARDKRTNEIVALKRLKMEKEKEGFPITSLREINTLLKCQHANIVTVREIVVGSNMDKIFIVMDYVEHDLKSLMETMRHKKQSFMPGEVKCLLKQLLQAVDHLHDNWILHRDLKTSNLLLSHKGVLKVGDFGLAREYGSPLKPYTPIVVTLWYRAPELLLGIKEYSTPIDMWSVGCIFAELLLMNALFPGKSEVDQLNRIFKDLGTPSEKIWPGFKELPAVKKMKFNEYPVSNLRAKFNTLSEVGLGMLVKFLTYDPAQRVTVEEAMKHTYFNEPPLPIDPAMFPTWPAKSELGHKRALAASPKPPSGGGEYKRLGGEDDDGYGFRLGMGVDIRRGGAGFSLKF
ncbi:serine/threonine-protein kinase PITSLRE isoform X2 [Cylas formicarius]|uniref:serine/threonine-protein kinase PITSLRE isoform X2 n=1 Tax=Cylas formicarius TaxID=197179 RepID=UPI002958BABB|nr:serine/threonine-protein kinase PITSLRE isoform X2 [Cylas formicarius]